MLTNRQDNYYNIQMDDAKAERLIHRIKDIYAGMDEAYSAAASNYGFTCSGCKQNCCDQRFYHHTFAEYYYLMEGVSGMDDELFEKVLRRARVVTETYLREAEIGEVLSLMCPLNFDGMCGLYEFRPMVCRLHGLPHVFRRPDGELITGEGCQRFQDMAAKPEVKVDRTPYYMQLAEVEKELRKELGINKRYKKTTAEMLMDMVGVMESGDEDPAV